MKTAYLEDDPDVASCVCGWLREAGHEVTWFNNGLKCVDSVIGKQFDVCLLDWMVPDLPGDEVLARLQARLQHAMPPVIFVSGRDSEEDIVRMLMAGADDYIIKPLSQAILLARLQAVLRRHGVFVLPEEQNFGSIVVNHEKRQISLLGNPVSLTERETSLALYFFQNIGRLLARDHLIQAVWGRSSELDTRTVDVHVSSLRRKIALTPEFGWRLVSIYGHGYRLERHKDST